jgi:hypothetical protein
MLLGRMLSVLNGMNMVAMRSMRMVNGFLMIAGFMMLCGFLMMARRMLVMLGCLFLVGDFPLGRKVASRTGGAANSRDTGF